MDGSFASKSICSAAGNNSAEKCGTGGDRCNEFLFSRAELVSKIIIEIDKDGGDNSSVIS